MIILKTERHEKNHINHHYLGNTCMDFKKNLL
jgi:hypothetical protein